MAIRTLAGYRVRFAGDLTYSFFNDIGFGATVNVLVLRVHILRFGNYN